MGKGMSGQVRYFWSVRNIPAGLYSIVAHPMKASNFSPTSASRDGCPGRRRDGNVVNRTSTLGRSERRLA